MNYKERQETTAKIVDRLTGTGWERLTDEELNMIVGVLWLADERIVFEKNYKESIEKILTDRKKGAFQYE